MNKFGLTGGPGPSNLQPTIDGVALEGVKAITIRAGTNRAAEVSLIMFCELDINIDSEDITIFNDPDKMFDELQRSAELEAKARDATG